MRVRSAITVIAVLCLFATGASAGIEIHEKHRFDARPGATVVIDVSFHSVEVTAQPGNTVDVTVDITFKGDGSSAKSAAVVFDASSGSLTVDGAMRELHSDVSSGSVRATVSRPLDVFTSDASSGSARLTGGAHLAKVESSSGSINVSGLLGEGRFSASSGSIKAQWDAIPPLTKVRASASSGSVTLWFPQDTKISGSVEVSSGGLHSDFPAMVRGKDRLQLDGGPNAVDIEVDTSSGSIKLLTN
jgi:DUF4097 and DUF4098 domain-containing protein YvlB